MAIKKDKDSLGQLKEEQASNQLVTKYKVTSKAR